MRHLLIDEYQDTNAAQDALVKLLGEGADSLCAVGDEDQAIYRWRGAEVEHILRFDERLSRRAGRPAGAQLPLDREDPGRGGGPRLPQPPPPREDAASPTGAQGARGPRSGASTRTAPRSRPWRARSPPPATRPGEIAILYRTNAQSRPFEEELVRRRIPYVVVGGMKFYERAEVKDVLAYLRLAARPEDDLAFRRVVNVPARGIGAASLDRLAQAARETGTSWWEVSADPPAGVARARPDLARALPRDRRGPARRRPPTWTPSALLEHLLTVTGLRGALRGLARTGRTWRGARTSRSCCPRRAEFERRNAEGATVAEYLDTVALATDADAAPGRRGGDALDAPRRQGARVPAGLRRRASRRDTCRTAQSSEDEDELEEERRLLYVGMTRAKDALTLTHADRRLVYGRDREPATLALPRGAPREGRSRSSSSGAPRPRPRSSRADGPPRAGARGRRGRCRRGKRVRHPRYGYGVILTEEGSGEETRLTVYFDRAGKKKFVARYADLTPA